ncbi:hypothetical protein M2447_002029 [Ereboglobus sp. PH5-10]|nr:hypothetical protein [Ereboglobus sp. PH5-10]
MKRTKSTKSRTLKTIPKRFPKRLPKTYGGLANILLLRPIHDETAYDNTIEMIDALAGKKLTPDQKDYLAILISQVKIFEKTVVNGRFVFRLENTSRAAKQKRELLLLRIQRNRLRRSSPAENMKFLIRLGVLTKEGKLPKHYGGK